MTLYIQLIPVLRGRPEQSGRVFWGIIIYSSVLFSLATVAIIGKIKFAELIYVNNRLDPSGPAAYASAHSEMWPNVMSQVRWGLDPERHTFILLTVAMFGFQVQLSYRGSETF